MMRKAMGMALLLNGIWACGQTSPRLAAGWRHSVAIDAAGEVLAWGENRFGQLGDGSFTASLSPVAVVGPDGTGRFGQVRAVYAGFHHTLALREDGSVWAWGNNAFGQLGNGKWGSGESSSRPVRVLGPGGEGFLDGVKTLAVGWNHTVALRADGTVWAWGSRCQGQLGDGQRDSASWSVFPVPVVGPAGEGVLDRVVDVACGAHHTLALRDDGTVWAWGSNWEGQLGTGRADAGGGFSGTRLSGVWTPALAGDWTVALAYVYTDPDHRDVADRIPLRDEYAGVRIRVADETGAGERRTARTSRNAEFVELASTLDYPAVAAKGEAARLVLPRLAVGSGTTDNDRADEVRLVLTHAGTGTEMVVPLERPEAVPVPVSGLGGEGTLGEVAGIGAGMFHSLAVLRNGRVVAWGYNGGGQLGEGTRKGFWEGNSAVLRLPHPVAVVAVEGDGPLEGIAAVRGGYEASWALTADGEVRSWGWNVFGELGSGSRLGLNRDRPQKVKLDAVRIVALAGGMRHALALDADGKVWGWGHNGFGQLAQPDRLDPLQPIPIVLPSAATATRTPVPEPTTPLPPMPEVELPPLAGLVVNVRDQGARGDGSHLDMGALQAAIDAAHGAGGGTVLLPPGVYRSGTLVLKDNVTLHLEKGATLLGSTNRSHYPVQALLYAEGARNIGISGRGVVDAQGQAWPSRGWRVQLIHLIQCSDIAVTGITTQYSGSWTQHYVSCRRLTIRGVTVNSPRPGRNNDGIDISGSEEVRIEGSTVISDDDAIVIKSQTRDRVNRDFLILGNRAVTYRGAFKIGTETRGEYRNLVVRDLEAWGAKAIEIYSVDGTDLEGVSIENVRAHDALAAILIRLGARLRPSYFQAGEERVPGRLCKVDIRNVEVDLSDKSYREILFELGIENAGTADCHRYAARESFISGLPGHLVEGVTIADTVIRWPGGGSAVSALATVAERPDSYPAAGMFGTLPAWGFYVRHARGIVFRNVQLELLAPDARPPLVEEDAAGLAAAGLTVHEAWH